MGKILDLAIAFDAEPPLLVQFTLQSPVDLKLYAIDLDVIPHLPYEKGVYRRRVATTDEFGHWHPSRSRPIFGVLHLPRRQGAGLPRVVGVCS